MNFRMIERLALRTAVFAVLTFAAFFLMQPLTIYTGFPEVLQGLKAAAVLAWAEVSIMWIRIAIQPRLDVQHAAFVVIRPRIGDPDPQACAWIFFSYQLAWAARLAAFLVLYGVL